MNQDAEWELTQVAAQEKISELEVLRQSLEEAKAKSAEHYDQWLRLKAEFENFRKRSERERLEIYRRAKEDMVLRLVQLMDVMEQAEKAAHASPDLKSVVAGLDLLYGEFRRLLKEEGLEEAPVTLGDRFNPAWQEAVATLEDGGEEGRVLSVLQKGYRFSGGLLRPARVTVSAAIPPGTREAPDPDKI